MSFLKPRTLHWLLQLKSLQAHIMKVVSKEPYWGETIPLRWLQFEEEKEASTRQMLKMNEV